MKRRRWKWILGLTGGLLLVVGMVVVDAHRRAAATFAFHEKELAAEIARLNAIQASRPPLLGDPLDENAWDFYGKAFDALDALPAEVTEAIPDFENYLEDGEQPDDHLLHGIFLEQASLVALFERGLRCRTLQAGAPWEEAGVTANGRITTAIRAGKYLRPLITHYGRIGKPGEALRLTALGLGLAQDLGRGGPVDSLLVQHVVESCVLQGIREVLASGVRPACGDLALLAERLDALDLQRPMLAEALDKESIYIRRSLLSSDVPVLRAEFGGFRRTWRWFFSTTLVRAQALNVAGELVPRAVRLGSLPVPRRVQESTQLGVETARHLNPLVRERLPQLILLYDREAVTLLQRTMLRVSLAVARYQADHDQDPLALTDLVPAYLPSIPDCPLTGKPLLYRGGTVWSVGRNGVDDQTLEDDLVTDDGGTGDVVWTVRRK